MSRSAGFSILQLIRPRSKEDGGLGGHGSSQPRPDGTVDLKETWMRRHPRSGTAAAISRPRGSRHVLSPLSPPPFDRPRSSSSSLCACEHINSISPTEHNSAPLDSGLDFLQALSLEPENRETQPTPSQPSAADSTFIDGTPTLPPLDFASSTRLSSLYNGLEDIPGMPSFRTTPTSPPPRPPPSTEEPLQLVTLPENQGQGVDFQAPVSPTSQGRVQRKGSPKSKAVKPHQKAAAAKPEAKVSRWTLSDNVTGLLSGRRLFHRGERGDVLCLTPGEVSKLHRLSKQAQDGEGGSRDAFHTSDSDPDDTSLEFFDADRHASRMREHVEPASFDGPVVRDFAVDPRPDALFLPDNRDEDPTCTKPPAVRRATSRGPIRRYARRQHFSNAAANADFIFLQSSSRSMVAPGFRHGAIRIDNPWANPIMGNGQDAGAALQSYQTATLGGAGDLNPETDDEARQKEIEEEEAQDVEALIDWVEAWYHRDPAQLGDNTAPKRDSGSTISSDGADDFDLSAQKEGSQHYSLNTADYDMDKSGPPAQKGDSQQYSLDTASYELDKLQPGSACTVKRESLISMPQSPMLDMQVIRSDDGDVECVPMGYNLSHDIGDFLQWEATHVYADTRYGDAR